MLPCMLLSVLESLGFGGFFFFRVVVVGRIGVPPQISIPLET